MSEQHTSRTISPRTFAGMVGLGAATTSVGVAAYVSRDESTFEPRVVPVAGRQPNLLVILADDLGWGDLSSYGVPSIRTPHLDKLAASGIRFTDGYAASSVCSVPASRCIRGATPVACPAASKSRSVSRPSRTASPAVAPCHSQLPVPPRTGPARSRLPNYQLVRLTGQSPIMQTLWATLGLNEPAP